MILSTTFYSNTGWLFVGIFIHAEFIISHVALYTSRNIFKVALIWIKMTAAPWHVCRSLAKDVHKVCMYIENNVSIINKHDLSVASVECSSIDCMAAAMEFEFFEIDLEVDKIEKRKFPMRNANMQKRYKKLKMSIETRQMCLINQKH
ncbi:hypothetical protein T02_4733 [Trichinella nativa]|uniref:Uncharacterized protein n=1 Tax=Trichinella nativa TaxID=6335 RepID=A0A0V1LNH1_9BILA|nr:hypothetical protein T02_4733 [Trichinella nativa]